VLSSFNIFEISFVCKKLVSFLRDTNLWQWLEVYSSHFSFVVLVNVLYYLAVDQFQLDLLLRTRCFPVIAVVFIFFYTISHNVFSSYVLFLS